MPESSLPPASSCCAPVLTGRLGREAAEQVAAAFKAIADPARLRLLNFLAAQPTAETCVCFLTEPLELSQPTVSHHLKVLHDAGLVGRERRGTWVYYRIVPERLAELRDALALPAAAPAAKPAVTPNAKPPPATRKTKAAAKAAGTSGAGGARKGATKKSAAPAR